MLLSILIPSYNHEKYVLDTLRAAMRIKVDEKEILVVDDGSRDGSVRLIQDYIAGEGAGANIRLIARENRGLVRTLNEGLKLAQGKYLYVTASDDIPIPSGVMQMLRVLEQDDNLQFAMGNALYMDSEEQAEFRIAHGQAHRRFFALPFDARHRELFLRYPQPILMQATVFRTSKLRAIGGWREDIVIDDYSLFLRMLSELQGAGKDFAFCPDFMTSFYRQHGANSHRNVNRQFAMVEEALAKLCPAQWRDEALLRNLIEHGSYAVRMRQWRSTARFIRSTIRQLGWLAFMHACAREAWNILRKRATGRRAVVIDPPVHHEPAASYIRTQSDACC